MRSHVSDVLPLRVRKSLGKFGADLAIARRKRRLTVQMMAERAGISSATYKRVEKGDPTVGMGAYAMCTYVLGFGDIFGEVLDPGRDEQGLALDLERLPKRVRLKREPTPQ